ncbi:MAG TPA: serine/threonine protein kinase [Candidatus Rothia avistercoris]|uniref:Serine/threonine protein kinase n=1 Tax=Candidatus Rothia avistercoris TaxID=2840479 RepID=A0A9D2ZTP0_9MICC|nr:serine/threonine protein kinase [Candidatus Rothia avistercoris]
MTEQIPLNTLLGDRYKVTAHLLDTASGDAVLEGLDTVLNRKVSIVVAAPDQSRLLVANARNSSALSRSAVQVLDLGNHSERTYLIISHSRPDTLLDVLLTEGGSNSAEEFGEEIFGDTGSMTAPNTYVVAKEKPAGQGQDAGAAAGAAAVAGAASISATRNLSTAEEEPADEFEEYDAEEEGYYEGDEPTERNGGMWVVGIAAVLLLVIGAGAVFASLGGMVDSDASKQVLDANGTAVATAPASASASASASATPSETSLPTPKIEGTFTRTVPSAPTLMAESDSLLDNLTDGNASTTWLSLAFGSANFGGLTDSFYLSAKLDEATTVNSITINQVSGVGGAFTIYANDSASIEGATEIGSGSFAATGNTTVQLDKDAQDGKTEYIIIQFTSAPQLSQPIVSGYVYGLRLAEISVK